MARQSKSRRKSSQSVSSGFGRFLLGVIVGSVGTALTMGVLQDRPSDIGSGIDRLIQMGSSQEQSEPSDTADENTEGQQTAKVVTYNFHNLLLEDEYILPDTNTGATEQASTTPAQQPAPTSSDDSEQPVATTASTETAAQVQQQPVQDTKGTYVLQVGSYQSFEDADRMKAKLAFSGLIAFIQKVSIEGRGDFYRVRLGPYDSIETMQSANSALQGQGINAVRFKVKG